MEQYFILIHTIIVSYRVHYFVFSFYYISVSIHSWKEMKRLLRLTQIIQDYLRKVIP